MYLVCYIYFLLVLFSLDEKEETLNTYVLSYRQPHEEDHDSPSGIGDHVIEYTYLKEEFFALLDEEAREMVHSFLKEGSIVFNHHIDGDGKTYLREFVKLVKVIGL